MAKKLRTSREAYDQVRWDPRFAPGQIVIGYEQHGAPPKEVRFTDFTPNGDIPFHRVLYFKHDGRIVWDRRARIDELDRLAKVAPRVEPAVAPGFSWRPIHRWTGTHWAEATHEGEADLPASLVVVTYNVLFDLFDAERLNTSQRIPLVLAALEATRADVIALEEVTPPFFAALLAAGWVRLRYFVSDGPEARTIDPYGQVILSRLPIARLTEHRFSRAKHVVVAELAGKRPVTVAAVHLTSDREDGAAATRARQLDFLLDHLARAEGDAVVLGDFNYGDEATLPLRDLVDAWATLRPTDPGFTFDPKANPLAAITSARGIPGRLDRVMVRGLVPTAIERFGDAPPFPSDHFGLRCELALEQGPVHTSALVLVPPEETWPPIQAIRAEHDRHFERWMPHVTLLYGFVPEDGFAAVVPRLEKVLATMSPFRVELARMRSFEHAKSATVWLEPATDPAGALSKLQAALEAELPLCDEQSSRSKDGFVPHLTIGGTALGDLATKLSEWQRGWRPIAFVAREIALISRRGTEPFAIRHRIPLGGVAKIAAACARITGRARPLSVYGSHALGIATPESDVDAVCIGPSTLSRETFFEQLVADGFHARARVVSSAFVPVVRLEVDGLSADIAYAREAHEGGARDPIDERSLSGLRDAEALKELVCDRSEAFVALAREVRAWAKARQIDEHAWGWPSRFAWTILAAHIARSRSGDLLAQFFDVFADWDWASKAVVLEGGEPIRDRKRDLVYIATPSSPSYNAARTMTRSTLAHLREELARGRRLLHSPSMSSIPDETSYAARLVLELGGTDDDLVVARGWLAGQMLGFLLALEEDPALLLRPHPMRGRRAVIGLDRPPSHVPDLAARFAEWSGRPATAKLVVRVEA